METTHKVVIDNGSDTCKAGFSGEDVPRTTLSHKVPHFAWNPSTNTDADIANQPTSKRGVLRLELHIDPAIVKNWDDMERIWHSAYYNELKVAPEEHSVLLTETPANLRINREKLALIFFESFQVPALYVAVQEVLALHASGRQTGVVIGSGDGVSHVVPVFEGHCLSNGILKLDIAGRRLTDLLGASLYERGFSLGTAAVREVKEKVCYVALDFDEEMEGADSAAAKIYTLPDSSSVTVGREGFQCPEALFQPRLVGMDCDGIHYLAIKSILKTDVDLHRHLFLNIIVDGGSTLFPGICQRLFKEIQALAPQIMSAKITAPQERVLGAWIGGSILSSLSSFESKWITKADFEDHGPSIVNRKCF
jgi:actin-related protein